MAKRIIHITEQMTENLEFTLLNNNNPTNQLMNAQRVEIKITSVETNTTQSYNSTDHPNMIAITDATNGIVTVYPTSSTFLHSDGPYLAQFIVTNSSAKTIPFPRGQKFEIQVDKL